MLFPYQDAEAVSRLSSVQLYVHEKWLVYGPAFKFQRREPLCWQKVTFWKS